MSDIKVEQESSSVLDSIVLRLMEDETKHSLMIELVREGFEQRLMELYQEFQRGDSSLGYLAEQLGVTSWEAVHLLEERGLHTSNL